MQLKNSENTLTSIDTGEVILAGLEQRVMNSAGMLAMKLPFERWDKALHRLIDLAETPRNIDQLWVWSRFLWVFGRRDTWKSNDTLTEMLYLLRVLPIVLREFQRCRWYQWRLRKKLREKFEKVGQQFEALMSELLKNELEWPERKDFVLYVGKLRGKL